MIRLQGVLLALSFSVFVASAACSGEVATSDSRSPSEAPPPTLSGDSLTYIALESTLRIYQQGDEAELEQIPAMARLTATPEELEPRAQRLARKLVELGLPAEVTRETSQAGSGTLPALDFPTWVVRIPACLGADAAQLARYLRSGNPPILARVRDGAVLLDVRTLEDSEFALIEKDLQQLTASKEPNWIR